MSKVQTSKGVLDRSDLQVKYIIEESDTSTTSVTEWYLKDEMVRRDVHVNMLVGMPISSDQEGL